MVSDSGPYLDDELINVFNDCHGSLNKNMSNSSDLLCVLSFCQNISNDLLYKNDIVKTLRRTVNIK